MAVEEVEGKDVVIRFDGSKCIHSRGCVLGHPDVFVPNVKGEWIRPDGATAAEVMAIALGCPSGAITARLKNGESSDRAPVVNTIRVRENGPLAMDAEFSINGEKQASPRATLCRCGQSKNKPFCDGSHGEAGFAATGEPKAKESEALATRNGPVAVSTIKNGPLRAAGNLEVVTGTGHTINRATELYLCRCGQSMNKPYCDGSHKAAGFEAD